MLRSEVFGCGVDDSAAEAAYHCESALSCARKVISRWDQSMDLPKGVVTSSPLGGIVDHSTRENRSQRWCIGDECDHDR